MLTTYSPRLDWSDPYPVAQYYQLQVATSNTFSAPVIDQSNIPASEFSPGIGLFPNTTYYWRVRAYNSMNLAGGWSYAGNFRTAVVPPTLSVPPDGQDLLINRPTFDWEDVSGATGYILQLSRNTLFTSLYGTFYLTLSTYTASYDLPVDTTFYWRVQSLAANGPSAWSEVRSLHSANPPSIPYLISPTDNILTTSYTPRLDWSNSTVPAGVTFDHYLVQISTNSAFTNAQEVPVTGITNSEYTPTADLAPNTTYYWRVRPYNTDGEYSLWTVTRTFRTAIASPALSVPSDGQALLYNRPTFDWNDVVGASGYILQISNNIGFTWLGGTFYVTPSTYATTFDLPVSVTLYWRVQSLGPNGPSAWSPARSLHTANPPGIPYLIAPTDAILTTNFTPRLDWSNSTVPTSTTFDHYLLQIATNSAFIGAVEANASGLTNSEYIPVTALAPNTTYYWRVRPYNTKGEYNNWSAVRTFRTAIAPPTLSVPEDGAMTTNRRPTFDWDDMSGATSYTIQISRDATFANVMVYTVVTPSTYMPASNLPVGKLYWRVFANGPNGPSQASAVRSIIEQ